ncbi:GSU2403 family nucleotidyltransferase fold protein [Henriciella sp.]|uniref:nucleotidyltransferase family protein n=1 Tax=Henriciella sp. TaxID=1968823 RepID=UPI002619E5BC|nr:GSU2403 family nucleotidyltransferase fold protein [Henriciella sp.]
MQSHPLSVQTTYQDLVEAHRMRAVSDLGGTPFLKTANSNRYWYARQRVGDRVVDRYIGPDSPELRNHIERAREAAEDTRQFERRCASMVAQLRAAGVPAIDRETGKVLNAMARVGTFRLGGTLVGTHAFRMYSAELGVGFPEALGVTSDVDIASFENLKLVIDDEVDPSLAETFKDLQLTPAPGLDRKNRPTRWVMAGGGTMVDFLVPKMLAEKDIVLLKPLGVYAQALSFLNFLIADPIPAVGLYRSGLLVQIPRPERYAIHKLIVAARRHETSAAKARKDLAQADILISILSEDRPYELKAAFELAMESGPQWRETIEESLDKLPDASAALKA